MGRLIDADKLIEQLREADRKCSNDIIKGCIGLVQTQYTAYDVEKVVEDLEKAECHMIGQHYFEDGIAEAISIVKRGGVE